MTITNIAICEKIILQKTTPKQINMLWDWIVKHKKIDLPPEDIGVLIDQAVISLLDKGKIEIRDLNSDKIYTSSSQFESISDFVYRIKVK